MREAFETAAMFGLGVLAARAIQEETERLSQDLTDENVLVVAQRAASLNRDTWETYAQSLWLLSLHNTNAQRLLSVGVSVRKGMQRIAHLLENHSSPRQAAEIIMGIAQSMSDDDQFGLGYALRYTAEQGNVLAEATLGHLRTLER
ncbi:MAG: hypothetical protein CUN51_07085 [Candidatus Thermofonsia Clade 1 bacterium]|uniref:Uncharacterized protein n=1 Tax=Candidatus Thermofonsia Clade 1 bacterium TaxID=2364210 RepID=A0A2M8NZ43_9CHLR|nr:MAG: hypothetical protein CUN51_07085 [Candidatus Thermofonsia Clade 1 bacterium]